MSHQPPDLAAAVGPTLRARRRAAGLSLGDVAVRTGLSVSQVSRIETGRSRPSLASLVAVGEALGVAPAAAAALALAPQPQPDDGVVARLGAVLSVRRALSPGEACRILEVSVATLRGAVAELAARLAPMGMTVVEDGERLGLVPHRALGAIAARASAPEPLPRLNRSHNEVLAIVAGTGQITRRRVDHLRGVDSAETLAQLVEWGLVRREGAEGRAPLYRGTAKLLEVTGCVSLDELRERVEDAGRNAASRSPGGE